MKEILFRNTLFGKEPYGIMSDSIKIIEAPNKMVDKLVEKYHYSHKATKNRFKSFIINNGLGFMQLGYGIRPHIKHNISKFITSDNYCEFDRMWLCDELPKNSESKCIGMLMTYLKIKYPYIKFVITYADGSVGNFGTIYKASNAIFIDKIPVDFYLLPSGERIHPVSMWHRHKTRAWNKINKIYSGIKHIKNTEFQYRYLYILSNKYKKLFLRSRSQERDVVYP